PTTVKAPATEPDPSRTTTVTREPYGSRHSLCTTSCTLRGRVTDPKNAAPSRDTLAGSPLTNIATAAAASAVPLTRIVTSPAVSSRDTSKTGASESPTPPDGSPPANDSCGSLGVRDGTVRRAPETSNAYPNRKRALSSYALPAKV